MRRSVIDVLHYKTRSKLHIELRLPDVPRKKVYTSLCSQVEEFLIICLLESLSSWLTAWRINAFSFNTTFLVSCPM